MLGVGVVGAGVPVGWKVGGGRGGGGEGRGGGVAQRGGGGGRVEGGGNRRETQQQDQPTLSNPTRFPPPQKNPHQAVHEIKASQLLDMTLYYPPPPPPPGGGGWGGGGGGVPLDPDRGGGGGVPRGAHDPPHGAPRGGVRGGGGSDGEGHTATPRSKNTPPLPLSC